MKKVLFFAVALMMGLSAQAVNAQNRGYEKSIEVGYAIGVGDLRNSVIHLSMINGFRFNNALFAGVGVGVGFSNALHTTNVANSEDSRMEAIPIPIFANIKVNLSSNTNITPFLSLNVGYTIDANQYLRDAPGFMIQPNFGVDFRTTDRSSIYGLVGFNLQNWSYVDMQEITRKSEMFRAIDLRIGFRF